MAEEMKRKNIRVLVFPEGDYYVAQCLEHDIAVQARSMPILKQRLEQTLIAHAVLAKEHREEPFKNLAPAPSEYWRQWDNADHSGSPFILTWPELDWIAHANVPQEAEMALA